MKKKTKAKRKRFGIVQLLFSIVSIISLGIFTNSIFKLNVLPMKYLGILYGIIGIVYLVLFILFFKKKCPKVLKIIAYMISIVLSILFIVGSYYLDTTTNFFKETEIGDYDTITYSVLALKEMKYELSDLNDKSIGYLNDENRNAVQEKLENKIDYEEDLENNANTLAINLQSQKVDAICLEQSYIAMLSEEIEDFSDEIEEVYSFKIQVKTHKENTTVDVFNEPFIVYISGIDQYGNVNTVRGRSDVNQLVVVNPTTHKILLLNTPRDYYVQLAGTTGLKDKLTHAGIYGIDKSINTLEELYGIDIHYYVRVNFDSLIQIVDTIGGVEVYSDTDLVLTHDKNCHIKVGMNLLNGKQALAYARERMGYKTGDRHRGENQQAIIKAIINKMTDSTVLLSRYGEILNALSGSFQTDMPREVLTDFIKKQLNEMAGWEIESYAVDGTGSSQPTYSMGSSRLLYVMEPDIETIQIAKQKIKEIEDSK